MAFIPPEPGTLIFRHACNNFLTESVELVNFATEDQSTSDFYVQHQRTLPKSHSNTVPALATRYTTSLQFHQHYIMSPIKYSLLYSCFLYAARFLFHSFNAQRRQVPGKIHPPHLHRHPHTPINHTPMLNIQTSSSLHKDYNHQFH